MCGKLCDFTWHVSTGPKWKFSFPYFATPGRDNKAPRRFDNSLTIYYNLGKPGHISKNCKVPQTENTRSPIPAVLNAILLEEVEFDPEEQQVMEGTLTLFNRCIKDLFNIGATDPFIII